MASRLDIVHFICDQAALGPRLTFRRMFGEFALYVDGKVTAFVCDDQLFLKPTPEALAYLGEVRRAPPYPGAREHFLLGAELEDPERLREALLVTARALPEARPARARAASKPRGTAKTHGTAKGKAGRRAGRKSP